MILILSIIVLVAIVSLYDYFSSRSWQRVTSNVRNNVVFEKRNKEYGAYVIRRDYDKTLLIIMGSMLFGIGGVSAAYSSLSSSAPEEVAVIKNKDATQVEIELDLRKEDDIKKEEEKKEEVVEDQPESQEKTVQNIEPVVKNEVVETKVLTQEELDALKTGAENKEKIGDGLTTTKKEEGKKEGEGEGETTTAPMEFPPVEAHYVGGQPKMAGFIQGELEYPTIAQVENIQGVCYLKFIVNADGTISSVKVLRGIPGCPECDKEAIRVLKAMPPWVPAESGGKKVPSYFNLSINFALD
jgi:protein TonB